jgi:hypothetical protein
MAITYRYRMAVIYSKWPYNYTSIFNSQALRNIPKLGFFKSGNPGRVINFAIGGSFFLEPFVVNNAVAVDVTIENIVIFDAEKTLDVTFQEHILLQNQNVPFSKVFKAIIFKGTANL